MEGSHSQMDLRVSSYLYARGPLSRMDSMKEYQLRALSQCVDI
jgi:hypothetical protein